MRFCTGSNHADTETSAPRSETARALRRLYGREPLETPGARNQAGQLEVYRYVYEGRQAKWGRPVGTFDCDHGHSHFDEFARYKLWRVGADGRRLNLVADNQKVGFCLMDVKGVTTDQTHLRSGLIGRAGGPVDAGGRDPGRLTGLGRRIRGAVRTRPRLDRGSGGAYAFFITKNPNRKIEEASANNAAAVYLTLENEKGVVAPEKVASHE